MNRKGVTLLEILVVVAIVASLLGAMMPSLARVNAQSRMLNCQSNLRQILTAFGTYAGENGSKLPGTRKGQADWLGRYNAGGRQPEDGVIFKRYLGSAKRVYTCPDDETRRPWTGPDGWFYSYTANALLSGTKPEMFVGAHYPLPLSEDDPAYNRSDHRLHMAPMDGVPLIMEEDVPYRLISVNDGSWCNEDGLTDRHLPTAVGGSGNIGYLDMHVGKFQWPKRVAATPVGCYLSAENLCLCTSGGKWISGKLAESGTAVSLLGTGDAPAKPDSPGGPRVGTRAVGR